ncbi:MAG: hypothetical protein ABIH63_03090 [archaeon]
MRRVDKELKRVNREIKHLEECVCTPLCKEEGIIPLSGNGCRAKNECEYLKYHFSNNQQRVFSLMDRRSYLEQKRDTMSCYS